MAEIGHNGGPPFQKLTAKHKLEQISRVMDLDVTAAQKCVGIGIIMEADTDWITPELSTERLRQYANVKDRETVYKATKELTKHEVVRAQKVDGKANRYHVLPATVVDAIVEAYNAAKTSRAKPDGVQDEVAVGSDPTCPVEPVGPNPTPQIATDARRAPTPARLEPPSGVNISLDNNKLASSGDNPARGLAGLNGSADPMISDIVGWMYGGDEKAARNWLSAMVSQMGRDTVRKSYLKLKTDLAEGALIAKPLQTWTKIAQRLKAEPAAQSGNGAVAETRRDRIRKHIEEAQAKKGVRPS